MLWRADPILAERIRQRLTLLIEFDDGTRAPAWPTDDGALEGLLSDLLNPAFSIEDRRARAGAWLDAQPPAIAWIADDAGQQDAATGNAVATAAIANLLDRQMMGSVVILGDARIPEIRELPGLSARTLALTAEQREAGASTRMISFSAGRWSVARPVVADPLRAVPPGLRLEPLNADWTLDGWLSGVPLPEMRVAPAWSTSALLHYRAGSASAAGGPGSWCMFIECRSVRAAGEELLVWLGPTGSAAAVLRVTPEGATNLGSRGTGRQVPVAGASVTRLPDRWIAHVPIPSHVIEPSGELRIGITRTDARGVRSAWPRPLLPWQSEPGRLLIDTGAWGDLERGTAVER
jgi:hypothetical protein